MAMQRFPMDHTPQMRALPHLVSLYSIFLTIHLYNRYGVLLGCRAGACVAAFAAASSVAPFHHGGAICFHKRRVRWELNVISPTWIANECCSATADPIEPQVAPKFDHLLTSNIGVALLAHGLGAVGT